MKVLIINGPNINLLGIREPDIYGENNYASLVSLIKKEAKTLDIKVKCVQTNYEGKIVSLIQNAYKKYDGIVINAGAYTHTSIAILDALRAVNILTVEVHISDINNREDFRKNSFISLFAEKCVIGKGFKGYIEALKYIKEKISKNQ